MQSQSRTVFKLINRTYKHKKSAFINCKLLFNAHMSSGMELGKVINEVKEHAPTSLAESWDNVGLLVEPSPPHTVNTILLTNDLTPPVLEEALGKKVDMILSYHPPIFTGIKRLRNGNWKERLIVKCIENRIAVYSPHTSYDAKSNGVNDWLISAFDTTTVVPINYSQVIPGNYSHKINVSSKEGIEKLQSMLSSLNVSNESSVVMNSSGDNMTINTILCNKTILPQVIKVIEDSQCDINTLHALKIEQVPLTGFGSGRIASLNEPLKISEAVDLVKKHLKLDFIRLAAKPGNELIKNVAVCAGSGSSVLKGVKADLYVTGEMSHHDVLDAVYNGSNVILCEHSNTERGYLHKVQQELSSKLTDVNIVVSETDSDPLKIV